eukprot:Selendium_serpulae@DN6060_c0_g1_i6.p1
MMAGLFATGEFYDTGGGNYNIDCPNGALCIIDTTVDDVNAIFTYTEGVLDSSVRQLVFNVRGEGNVVYTGSYMRAGGTIDYLAVWNFVSASSIELVCGGDLIFYGVVVAPTATLLDASGCAIEGAMLMGERKSEFRRTSVDRLFGTWNVPSVAPQPIPIADTTVTLCGCVCPQDRHTPYDPSLCYK